jgi:hypothetical protein
MQLLGEKEEREMIEAEVVEEPPLLDGEVTEK